MKFKTFLKAFFVFVTVIFFVGCGNEENHQLRESNKKLEAKIQQNTKELEKTKNELKQAQEQAASSDKKYSVLLCSILIVVSVVVLAVILFFVLASRKAKNSSIRSADDSLHCPRCGWEHALEDKVCINPECRTRF